MSEITYRTIDENMPEVLRVRREKLFKLQDDGRNPFEIEKYDVTAFSVGIKENFEEYEGKEA